MRPVYSFAASLLLVLLLMGPALVAQSATGEVNGTVVDASGAVVSGAKVSVTNQGTKITNTTTSNSSGYFIFLNLQPGTYVLVVEMAGFKKIETAAFNLGVNQTLTQPVTLGVGGVTEVVEVTAQAPMLQVSSSELGTVIPEKAVNDLPLNGRNFTQLLTLTPGATPVSTAQGSSVGVQDAGISAIPSSSFSKPAVHGQVNRSTLYFLDGVINTDLRGPVYGVLPIIDSIDEFKVQSHNDKAEYGGVLGGVVNVASKSGGNGFHGSGWEFVRNNVFDARDGFKDVRLDPTTGLNVPVDAAPFHQNEYGGTFGGPIHRNKTFFFVGYEGWRYSKPTQNEARIPTAAELSGDFTLTPSSNKQIFNPFSTFKNGSKFQRNPFRCDAFGQPLPTNASGQQAQTGTPCLKLPASLINPAMQSFLQAYLLAPNAALANGDNFIETRPLIDNANSWMARVDHHISDRDSVFFRFSQMLVHHLDHVIGTVEEQPSDYHANNFGGGWVHSFRSNLILDVSGGVLRKPYVFNQAKATIGTDKLKSLGLSVDQFNGLVATLASPWFTNEIGNRGDSIRNNPDWSAAGNLDWIHGKHNFRFGGQYVWLARDQINTFQTFGFSGALTGCPSTPCPGTTGGSGGLSLASALLGFPTSSSGELPAGGEVNFSLATYSIYGEDQWKILPTLTLNIGLRWDFTTTPSMANNRLSNGLDLFRQQWLIGSSPLPTCGAVPQNPCLPAGFFTDPHQANIVFTEDKNFMAPAGYSDYGPRFGFAWQPMRNTVVRGGIGIYWDTVSARSQYVQNDIEAAQWPWVRAFSGAPNSTGNAGAPGFPLVPINQAAGNLTAPVPAAPWNSLQSTFFDDPRYKDPWSEQWNLAIERQLSHDMLLSVGYVGSRNGHMAYTGNANASPVVSASNTAAVDNLRAIPWVPPSIHYSQSIGYGNYNSLQVKFQRNFSRGLMTLISYTWSKSLDTSSGYFGVENGAGQNGSSVQNYFDPRSNYSVSGFDVPHFFSWYTVYELPFGQGKRWLQGGPMSWLFGNLQTNYIFQARSGQPFNLNVNGDPASISGVNFGTLSGYARPNLIGNPIPGNQTAAQWFDPSAFAVPAGSFGNFSRNGLRSARVVNMDVSLFKNVPLGESRKLQLRAEAFNIFNIQSLAAPTGSAATIRNTQAGKITSIVGNPRQLQFGARFIF
jgi:hypothetical protein